VRNKTVSKSLVKISTLFVHSCRGETRLAVFSVPFPPKKVPNVFLPVQWGLRRHTVGPFRHGETEHPAGINHLYLQLHDSLQGKTYTRDIEGLLLLDGKFSSRMGVKAQFQGAKE
jgi:hypothetical protein